MWEHRCAGDDQEFHLLVDDALRGSMMKHCVLLEYATPSGIEPFWQLLGEQLLLVLAVSMVTSSWSQDVPSYVTSTMTIQAATPWISPVLLQGPNNPHIAGCKTFLSAARCKNTAAYDCVAFHGESLPKPIGVSGVSGVSGAAAVSHWQGHVLAHCEPASKSNTSGMLGGCQLDCPALAVCDTT